MTGYLQRLATRLVEPQATIRPRVASRFEAQASWVPAAGRLAIEAQGDRVTAGQRPQPPARRASPVLSEATQPAAAQAAGHDLPRNNPPAARPQPEPVAQAGARVDAGSQPRPVAALPRTLSASPEPREPMLSNAMDAALKGTAGGAWGHGSPQLADPAQAATAPRPTSAGEDLLSRPAKDSPDSTAPTNQTVGLRVTADETASAPDASLRPGSDDRALATPAWPPQPIAPRRRPHQSDAENAAPTVVEVTIGSVEVRGPAAAATPARPARAAVRAGATPRLNLQDYLHRRSEGGR
jgi:hypothetical protein